ncbi:MAG TPA: PPOX class F420-dependent oxidoreductase [Thermomicrobiales bacterium]|nr:PPOX class F420-dependent oxidoreductase [Thermomicrobiales bacterium]
MTTNGKLSAAEREFLTGPRFAVLATIGDDGTPQQTVMWYELRGDRIMMNTTASRVKNANVRRDPRVSICVEDGYTYVTLRGSVSEIIEDRETAVNDIISLALRYHPGTSAEDHTMYAQMERQTLLIDIDKVISHGLEG